MKLNPRRTTSHTCRRLIGSMPVVGSSKYTCIATMIAFRKSRKSKAQESFQCVVYLQKYTSIPNAHHFRVSDEADCNRKSALHPSRKCSGPLICRLGQSDLFDPLVGLSNYRISFQAFDCAEQNQMLLGRQVVPQNVKLRRKRLC